jgi:HEAT repeat protein
MSAEDVFAKIAALDEQIAALKEEFDAFTPEERETALAAAFERGLDALGEEEPIPVSLVRAAEMLIGLGRDSASELLADGLGHANPELRLLSGDALLHMAEDGLELVMPAVEKVLAAGGIGAEEMPFLLTDVDHPETPRVLERFLAAEDANTVAAAIEALAEYGDPSAVPALEKLTEDTRAIEVEEGDETAITMPLGQLASEALEILSEEE